MRLVIYPNPIDAHCEFHHDSGITVIGTPVVDSNGRPGQTFELPDNTPSGWGARITISKPAYFDYSIRGIAYTFDDHWIFLADDFSLTKVPDPVIVEKPVPVEVPPPSYPKDAKGIIDLVYKVGHFDFLTKEGCGKFTEAVCEELHKNHSVNWGHIRKFGSQNNYNGHAVDAIQLLENTADVRPGVYDLIYDSESPNAKLQFIYKGEPDRTLWYYPA